MKKILTSLVMVVTTSTFAFQYPMQSNYVVTDITTSSVPLTNMEQFVTIKNEPQNILNGSAMGYFAMTSIPYEVGVLGYMGLQKDSSGKKVIFSTWDPPASTGLTVRPAHSNCTRFGHEGTGVMCLSKFEWHTNVEYKLSLTRTGETSYGDMYQVRIVNMQNNDSYEVGKIEMPTYRSWSGAVNQGYGGVMLGGVVNTIEYYTGPYNLTCNTLPYMAVEWRGPFGNNGTVFPTASQAITSNYLPEQCPANTSATMLNESYTVLYETGGNVVSNMENEKFVLDYDKTLPLSEIDCLLNRAERMFPDLFDQSKFKENQMSKKVGNMYGRDYSVNNDPHGVKLMADLKTNTLQFMVDNVNNTVAVLNDSTKQWHGCKF